MSFCYVLCCRLLCGSVLCSTTGLIDLLFLFFLRGTMPEITQDAILIENYINKTWKKFQTKKEVPLRNLVPEPKNKGLKHIWKYGTADVVVFRNGKVVCVIEPGGSHHFQDEKQIKNDARKWKLCDINGVKCLHLVNGVISNISKRQLRNMIGKLLFNCIVQ